MYVIYIWPNCTIQKYLKSQGCLLPSNGWFKNIIGNARVKLIATNYILLCSKYLSYILISH